MRNKLRTKLKILISLVFAAIIILAFAPPLNLTNGWYQQFMPFLNNRPISDITFIDSLTGYAVTPYTVSDTAYIVKTTNGGDNWNVILRGPTNTIGGFNRIQFLNLNTGYACGNFLWKTVNGGLNWDNVNTSGIFPQNMWVLNEDTIWLTNNESLTGGVYRTTNGGGSWDRQLALGNDNPTNIYFFNARIGFITKSTSGYYMKKTTDGGLNWFTSSNNDAFVDIYFIDSLTGWKAFGTMKKTTDGGLSWINQTLPSGGLISGFSEMKSFKNINKDSIWGGGGYLNYGGGRNRGILYFTTNGGTNWLFQLPDTNFGIPEYDFINFTDKRNGWCYESYFSFQTSNIITSGVHTTTGGDTTWYMGVQQLSHEIPKDFILKQNYPNPFNPRTVIPYSVKSSAHVKLIAYDILGKEVQVMVNNFQQPGEYEVDFMGKFSSSGVYFYRMSVDDKVIDTKKMILIK